MPGDVDGSDGDAQSLQVGITKTDAGDAAEVARLEAVRKRKSETLVNPPDEKKQKSFLESEGDTSLDQTASTLSKPEVPTGSLKRKLEGGEDHSVTNAERMSQIAFVRALKDSRRADKENTDHLVMRQYTKTSFSEEPNGAKAGWEAEIERIGTADEWAKFTDWKLIRKVMNIGFHVYKQDGCGGIKFGWSDPMDDTNKRLVMVGVLFDGVHYDLIVFGEPTDAQLNGFV